MVSVRGNTFVSEYGYSIFGMRELNSSFRDGPKDQTRNLEIPGSALRTAPE
jgi:hypothetical protein